MRSPSVAVPENEPRPIFPVADGRTVEAEAEADAQRTTTLHGTAASGFFVSRYTVERHRELLRKTSGEPSIAVNVHLLPQPATSVREADHHRISPTRSAMSCSLLDLQSPREWRVCAPADVISFVLPDQALADWAASNGFQRFAGLEFESDRPFEDDVLRNIGLAMLPSFDDPRPSSGIFIDYLIQALCRYLVVSFGKSDALSGRGGLAPWQVRIAKQFMAEHLAERIALADIAAGCRVSVSHFAKSFRATLGVTPHQWLIGLRIERAQALLEQGDLKISEVAAECGFADQSHFTRVFTRNVKIPPGCWRRAKSG